MLAVWRAVTGGSVQASLERAGGHTWEELPPDVQNVGKGEQSRSEEQLACPVLCHGMKSREGPGSVQLLQRQMMMFCL